MIAASKRFIKQALDIPITMCPEQCPDSKTYKYAYYREAIVILISSYIILNSPRADNELKKVEYK